VGTIVGRVVFQNYLAIYQNVTIGGIHDRSENTIRYPKIDEYVSIYANSTILGSTVIGKGCIIGANTFVRNLDIPEATLVTGQYPKNEIRPVPRFHISPFIK
jgi:serine O-acetyltransferase